VAVSENRGEEIGVTLTHPHGQIYAYLRRQDALHRRLAAGAGPRRPDLAHRYLQVFSVRRAPGKLK
jgi:UDPglucose--hexose-1-phosphate uridylyltransferase